MDTAGTLATILALGGVGLFVAGAALAIRRRALERRLNHFVRLGTASARHEPAERKEPSPQPFARLRQAVRRAVKEAGPAAGRLFARRRLAAFERQLPDAIDLMSSSLRSGSTLSQAIDAIVREMDAPLSSEFKRVQREVELGLPLVEALGLLHERLKTNDVLLLASAVGIQHRVGGDLSPILTGLSHTIRERQRIRGEINVLTAQARYSAMLVGALPVLLFAFLWLTNYAYISNLFLPGLRLALVLGIAAEVLGFILMRRMASVEV